MKRIPKHIGIIPDGNRRWAEGHGLPKEDGYDNGLAPGLRIFKECQNLGVEELTFYGFTQDNTKRPSIQVKAFQKACVDAVEMLLQEDAALLVMGNTRSPMFPNELLPYTTRTALGQGKTKVNFLVNYGWEWDLSYSKESSQYAAPSNPPRFDRYIHSSDISRIDLIIRWGGRRRLSGLLPIQSVYADFFVIDEYWPDFKEEHLHDALDWYQQQDITLGG